MHLNFFLAKECICVTAECEIGHLKVLEKAQSGALNLRLRDLSVLLLFGLL